MRHSIYFRNFIATALIVLISFTLLGGLSTAWNYRRSLSERRAAMTSTLNAAARFVATQHLYQGLDLDDLNISMWLAMFSDVSGFDLLVTDTDGTVSACSDWDLRHLGKSVPESAMKSLLADSSVITLSSLGEIYSVRRQISAVQLTMSINGETFVSGYMLISDDLASFRRVWMQFTSAFLFLAVCVMALAFVISFVTTKRQAEPLKQMVIAARRFARGDFSARVDDRGRYGEIGQLTQAFNAMADSLDSSEKLRRGFVASLSHELKTPMTVIAGFADGILDGTIPAENEDRYLSVISSETRRLSRLVGSMLDVSKLQSTDAAAILKDSFDISEVVRLSILSLEGKIEERRLDIEAKLPEAPIMTRGDEDAITQVVYNLIDNAIKFSEPESPISLAIWKEGDRAYVSVENIGETIPPDDIPHIFDRFHKADKSRSADRDGVGLGLYIVKTILDSHNENVFVTSSGGVTKFVFTLTIRD